MYEFKLKLADRVIAVKANYPSTEKFCSKYTVSEDTPADFSIEMYDEDVEKERLKSYSEDDFEGKPRREFSCEYLETLALYRKIADAMLDFGVLLFHGSVISVDGYAYLFTAKSGTGKSTHTRLWRQLLGDRAVMVNDDKPLIAVDNNGSTTVYGTPWCGKHSLGDNIKACLRAICILERAVDNSITAADPRQVYPLILQQTYRPSRPDKLMKMLPLVDKLMKNVTIYTLGCNMDISAAKLAYSTMSGEEI